MLTCLQQNRLTSEIRNAQGGKSQHILFKLADWGEVIAYPALRLRDRLTETRVGKQRLGGTGLLSKFLDEPPLPIPLNGNAYDSSNQHLCSHVWFRF